MKAEILLPPPSGPSHHCWYSWTPAKKTKSAPQSCPLDSLTDSFFTKMFWLNIDPWRQLQPVSAAPREHRWQVTSWAIISMELGSKVRTYFQ